MLVSLSTSEEYLTSLPCMYAASDNCDFYLSYTWRCLNMSGKYHVWRLCARKQIWWVENNTTNVVPKHSKNKNRIEPKRDFRRPDLQLTLLGTQKGIITGKELWQLSLLMRRRLGRDTSTLLNSLLSRYSEAGMYFRRRWPAPTQLLSSPPWALYQVSILLTIKWMTVSLQSGITCQTLNYWS